jgi:hypothetical protein
MTCQTTAAALPLDLHMASHTQTNPCSCLARLPTSLPFRYTLYQLYKASTSAKGGQRLNKYLNHDPNVRVCYAAEERWVG